jgi:DNA polymerase-4
LSEALEDVIDSVWQRIENNSVAGRTVTLKVKYADFRQITRSKSCEQCLTDKGQFGATARELLAQLLPVPLGVRLIGLTLSGLSDLESLSISDSVNHMINSQREFDF